MRLRYARLRAWSRAIVARHQAAPPPTSSTSVGSAVALHFPQRPCRSLVRRIWQPTNLAPRSPFRVVSIPRGTPPALVRLPPPASSSALADTSIDLVRPWSCRGVGLRGDAARDRCVHALRRHSMKTIGTSCLLLRAMGGNDFGREVGEFTAVGIFQGGQRAARHSDARHFWDDLVVQRIGHRSGIGRRICAGRFPAQRTGRDEADSPGATHRSRGSSGTAAISPYGDSGGVSYAGSDAANRVSRPGRCVAVSRLSLVSDKRRGHVPS